MYKHHKNMLSWALLMLLLIGTSASAGPVDEAYLAVVQIPSHGASGTIISTKPGETVVLTVAHAFEGDSRNKPLVINVPQPGGADTEKKVGIRLAAIDTRADLALVVMGVGPLDHSARVAPKASAASSWAYSCGYDGMKLPATQALTRVRDSQGQTTFTEKIPGHGRSGGALFDADSGQLIGVVQGYTVERPSIGIYASLGSIHTFLERNGYGRVLAPAAAPASGENQRSRPFPPAGLTTPDFCPAPSPAHPCPQ